MDEKEPRAGNEILDQLRELGGNLEHVIRKVWESQQGREIREQFQSGLRELNAQIACTLASFRDDEEAQGAGAGEAELLGEETAESLRQGIRDALKALNDQVSRLVETIPDETTSDKQGDED